MVGAEVRPHIEKALQYLRVGGVVIQTQAQHVAQSSTKRKFWKFSERILKWNITFWIVLFNIWSKFPWFSSTEIKIAYLLSEFSSKREIDEHSTRSQSKTAAPTTTIDRTGIWFKWWLSASSTSTRSIRVSLSYVYPLHFIQWTLAIFSPFSNENTKKTHFFSKYPRFVQSNQHMREISASVQAAAASQHGGQPIQIGALSITKGL